MTVHGSSSMQGKQNIITEQENFVAKKIAEFGQVFTTVSIGTKKMLEDIIPTYDTKKIRNIPNFIAKIFETAVPDAKASLELRKRYGITIKDTIILMVGSYCERKNQEQVIHVCGRHKPWYVENRMFIRNK